jgi:LysR family transcriptional regulator, glycine cleavage system transcriptional activator
MKNQLPPLSWLRAFEAAARHLSFTLAAQELGLTQAAVSKQVKLLEHHLGEALFHRQARSLSLSKAALSYLPSVQDGFERIRAGTEEVFAGRKTGILTLRVQSTFSVNWLAPRLPDFFAAHPGTPLRIISIIWADDPDAGQFDLDIRYGSGRWNGYHCDRLSHDRLRPLCSARTARELSHPADLEDHRLLHVLGHLEGWGIWLKAAGLPHIPAGAGIQFDTSLLAYQVAASHGGIALGRNCLCESALASGALVAPFELSVPVEEAFYLLRPQDRPAHPDSDLFRDWVLQQLHAGTG